MIMPAKLFNYLQALWSRIKSFPHFEILIDDIICLNGTYTAAENPVDNFIVASHIKFQSVV